MTLYDLTQWVVQGSRGLLVLIGLLAFRRILFKSYLPGDTVRFALGIAALASLNSFFMRVHFGLITWDEIGSTELIISNIFYTCTVLILVFIISQESRAFK